MDLWNIVIDPLVFFFYLRESMEMKVSRLCEILCKKRREREREKESATTAEKRSKSKVSAEQGRISSGSRATRGRLQVSREESQRVYLRNIK